MIEPMKKVTLLCLASDTEKTLETLGSLAAMHLNLSGEKPAADTVLIAGSLDKANRCVNILAEHIPLSPDRELPGTGEECVSLLLNLQQKKEEYRKNADLCAREEEMLLPWGNFDPEQVKKLEEKDIWLLFCRTGAKEAQPPVPDNVCVQEVGKDSSHRYFILAFREQPDPSQYPVVELPSRSLAQIRQDAEKAQTGIAEMDKVTAMLAGKLSLVQDYAKHLKEEYQFSSARDSMTSAEQVVYITGFVPQDRIAELTETARRSGWALLINDPDKNDESVPTCIRKPSWLSIMDPLFDFIGVTPGYREHDVNAFFLFFFPLFFGMIIGDAAYGIIFLLSGLLGRILLRKKPAAKLPCNLFMLLACCSLTWGWLSGSWFGLSRNILPSFMQGWVFLADPGSNPCACAIAEKFHLAPDGLKDKFVQYFCFLIAAVHLVLARLFKFACDIRNSWRETGNLGWALLIAGNFFLAVDLIVFPGSYPGYANWLYAAGLLLIIVTTSPADFFNLPFDAVGSFVDVLSYIRLFAVGLSGAYIAGSFNTMALPMLNGAEGWKYALAVLAVVLIAAFGHLLNIALGFLSVLVHGVRLNTLEFSKHCGLQWAGAKYEPFTGRSAGKDHIVNKTQETTHKKEF